MAAVLIVVHIVWPSLAIDATTVALLLVMLLPWILPYVRSVELPGGTKIELQPLEDAGDQFLGRNVEPSARIPTDDVQPAYISVGLSDPNLALAGLRIELEKRLADAYSGPLARPGSTAVAIDRLRRRGMLSGIEADALVRIVRLLNEAVHGAEVDIEVAEWALTDGPRIIASLDSRLHAINDEYDIENEARRLFKQGGAKIVVHLSTHDFPPMVAGFADRQIAFEAVALPEDFRLEKAVDHISRLITGRSATEGVIVTSRDMRFPAEYDGIPIICIDDMDSYIRSVERPER